MRHLATYTIDQLAAEEIENILRIALYRRKLMAGGLMCFHLIKLTTNHKFNQTNIAVDT